METAPNRTPVSPKRLAIILSASFVLLILCAGTLVVHTANSGGKIYPEISVLNVEIGGLTRSGAIEALTRQFGDSLDGKSITLKLMSRQVVVPVRSIDALADIPATVEAAYLTGRGGNPFQNTANYFRHKANPHEIPLNVSYNLSALFTLLDTIALPEEVEVEDSFFTVENGILTVDRGKSGLAVDRDAFKELFGSRLSSLNFTDMDVELSTVQPEPIDIDEMYAQITLPPLDAMYLPGDPEPTVLPGREQVITSKNSIAVILNEPKNRYEIPVNSVKPEKTREYLEERLFRDTLASTSTSFAGSSWERVSNVNLTVNRVNDTVLMPGETFSYDEAVGPRTPQNGYQLANVYINNKIEVDYGGGICQTSSTLYTATLYANMEIVERTSHSLPVAYLPGGQDATIAAGYIDFKFRNDTEFPVKILASTNGTRLTVSIMGTDDEKRTVKLYHDTYNYTTFKTVEEYDETVPVGTKRIKQSGAGGYTVSSVRKVFVDDKEVKSEVLPKSVYHPMDRIELINPGDKGKPFDSTTNQVVTDEDPTEPIDPAEPTTPVTSADPQPPQPPTEPDNPAEYEEIVLSIDDV